MAAIAESRTLQNPSNFVAEAGSGISKVGAVELGAGFVTTLGAPEIAGVLLASGLITLFVGRVIHNAARRGEPLQP